MIKVLVIDDHPIVRQGFVQLIEQNKQYEVVGEAEDAVGGSKLIDERKPDLVLLDISLKNSNGIELLKDIVVNYPHIKVLVVSLHDEMIYAPRVLKAGACGYIMKSEATEKVLAAVKVVMTGDIYVSDTVRSTILKKVFMGDQKSGSPVDALSDRELEVFQYIADGLNTKETAAMLNLSVKTVETYKSHIKSKLKLKNSTELLQYAVKWSLSQKHDT